MRLLKYSFQPLIYDPKHKSLLARPYQKSESKLKENNSTIRDYNKILKNKNLYSLSLMIFNNIQLNSSITDFLI